MSYDRTPLQILADGVNQAIQFGAPADMVARLRGAHAYAGQTGIVLRDETMQLRKQASAPVIEVIPTAAMPHEVE